MQLIVLCTILCLVQSCKKDPANLNDLETTESKISLDEKSKQVKDFKNSEFFSLESKLDIQTKGNQKLDNFTARIRQFLYDVNEVENFTDNIILHYGIPDWSNSINVDNKILWLPLVKNKDVTGIFNFYVEEGDLYFRLGSKSLLEKIEPFNINTTQVLLYVIRHFNDDSKSNLKGPCEQPCGWIGSQCRCTGNILQGPASDPSCCGDNGGSNNADTEEWGLFDAVLFNLFGGNQANDEIDTSNNSGFNSNNSTDRQNAMLINNLSNEQIVIDALISILNIPVSEDGSDNELLNLLAANPQIMNPIYLYLNGYYEDVEVDIYLVNDLLDLMLDHPLLDLGQMEIELLLTFEPDLVNSINTF